MRDRSSNRYFDSELMAWAIYLVMVTAALSGSAQAALPIPYGVEFVRHTQLKPDATLEPSPSASIETKQFTSQLSAAQSSGGPYSDALEEPLVALGRVYVERGEHALAEQHYSRALHIVRINEGLSSERQIPLVRALLNIHRKTGEFEALDDSYDYFFRLHGNGHGEQDVQVLAASLEYFRWQRDAVLLELGSAERRLLNLIELNNDLLETLGPSVEYRWRRDLTLSQLRNYYLLRHRLDAIVQQLEAQRSLQHSIGAAPQPVDLQLLKLQTLYRNAPSAGRLALEALLPLASEQGYVEVAALQLALADWQFWNGLLGSKPAYRQVVQTLRQAGDTERLAAWLSDPTELPDHGELRRHSSATSKPVSPIQVRFDVSSSGWVHKIRLLSGQESVSDRRRLKRSLAKTRFRPRWVNGKPQAAVQVGRSYEILR